MVDYRVPLAEQIKIHIVELCDIVRAHIVFVLNDIRVFTAYRNFRVPDFDLQLVAVAAGFIGDVPQLRIRNFKVGNQRIVRFVDLPVPDRAFQGRDDGNVAVYSVLRDRTVLKQHADRLRHRVDVVFMHGNVHIVFRYAVSGAGGIASGYRADRRGKARRGGEQQQDPPFHPGSSSMSLIRPSAPGKADGRISAGFLLLYHIPARNTRLPQAGIGLAEVRRHRKRRPAYDIVYQTKEDLHMSGCNIFEDNCMNWVLLVGIVLVLMMCCN